MHKTEFDIYSQHEIRQISEPEIKKKVHVPSIHNENNIQMYRPDRRQPKTLLTIDERE